MTKRARLAAARAALALACAELWARAEDIGVAGCRRPSAAQQHCHSQQPPFFSSVAAGGAAFASSAAADWRPRARFTARPPLPRGTAPRGRSVVACAAHPTDDDVRPEEENEGRDGRRSATSTSNTLELLASNLSEGKYENVVVVVGAGASVSAGIPDFRTPGTGLYDKMDHYDLPFPEAVFDLQYYRANQRPFVDLARELWPGQEGGPRPTLAHSFVRLLEGKGCLRRVYTQNIDGLERLAGVGVERLVECHGHFRSASCTSPECRKPMTADDCRDAIMKGDVPKCPDCGKPAKPDVVFFGEELPTRFSDLIDGDVGACDLLVVMGTSLLVAPVAGIPEWVGRKVPRILINRELVGHFETERIMAKNWGGGYERDVFVEGDCDDGVAELCRLAGWEKELEELHDAAMA